MHALFFGRLTDALDPKNQCRVISRPCGQTRSQTTTDICKPTCSFQLFRLSRLSRYQGHALDAEAFLSTLRRGGGRTPSFWRPHPNLVKRVVSSITLMICSQICILSICVHHLVFCCPCPRNWWVYMRCLRWTMAMAAKATTSYFTENNETKENHKTACPWPNTSSTPRGEHAYTTHWHFTNTAPTLHRHFADTFEKFFEISNNSRKF